MTGGIMSRLMQRFVLTFVLLAAAGVSAFAQGLPPYSYWKNQRGSEMKIFAVDPQGNFTGLYINNAPGYQCQGLPGFALSGRNCGTNVTFTVVWNNGIQNCHSRTIWQGHMLNPSVLPTTWVLIPDSGPRQQGADLFTQQR
jgi:hypothetical protein